MPSDNTNNENTPPVDEQTAAPDDSGVEPREWTLTEADIREIKASGITLGDVIREIEAQIASARE